jgi:hypothetical protein
MKKILIFVSAVSLTAGIFAQPVLQVSDKAATYPVSITADINSDFTWTKNNGTVVSNVFGSPTTPNATLSSQGITINAAANNGDETQITVSAVNTLATSCVTAVTKQLIVRYVTTPSYSATIGTTTQGPCQNAVAANITVNLTAVVGGSTINSFTYYIDANDNGSQDPTEISQTVPVGAVAPTTGTIDLSAFSTATVGVQPIRVTSVNGTTGVTTLSSAVTTNNVQTITINALPVLGNFSF